MIDTGTCSSPIKVVARAVVDNVLVALHRQKVLAIVAAIVLELVEGFDQTAGQARPQSTQILGDAIEGHCDGGFVVIRAGLDEI